MVPEVYSRERNDSFARFGDQKRTCRTPTSEIFVFVTSASSAFLGSASRRARDAIPNFRRTARQKRGLIFELTRCSHLLLSLFRQNRSLASLPLTLILLLACESSRMLALPRATSKLDIRKGGSSRRGHSYSLNREISVLLSVAAARTSTHTDPHRRTQIVLSSRRYLERP